MKLAVMQPYLFPYLGYFQLVAAVDKFVFYDDVAFIKNGWINRNRILVAGKPAYFTVPLSGASPNLRINDLRTVDGEAWRTKLAESLRHAYARAPYFKAASTLFAEAAVAGESSIAEMAKRSILAVADYLRIETAFVPSSTTYGNAAMRGSERVLDICRREYADQYLNLPGGKDLYEASHFAAAGVALRFIEPRLPAYRQGPGAFQPGLSILDVLMFNSRDEAAGMLATNLSE